MSGNLIAVSLADEPDLQRQTPSGWDLGQGNLMLMGIAGSGTSTTLSSIALTAAAETSPEDLDILCLDMGSRDLAPLAELPHIVAYVGSGAGAKEKQTRFLRHLLAEFERRRSSDEGTHRRALVLLDGLATLRDEFQDYHGQELLDGLYRVYADGPSVGMWFAVSTTRAKAVPSAMDEVTTQKWLFRLADAYDYSALGVRGTSIPAAVPGRYVDTTTLSQSHVAIPADGLASAVDAVAGRWAAIGAKRDVIGSLPDRITVAELGAAATIEGEPWPIPVGVREDTLAPAMLEVYEEEHLLIAGPSRSGKSTLLLAVAETVRASGGQVWGIHDRRSPLATAELDRTAGSAEEIPALVASLRLEAGPVVLLIDDAERVEDTDQSIASLISGQRPGLCIVAAGRSGELRSLYSHWTKEVRKARCGVLLQPDLGYDGDLLGASLPSRAPVAVTPGRGYACSGGVVVLVQSVSPTGT
ncbi:FtsK/SpoIIIE domain-containing protein [Leifsonia xyli]|uniref:FtsK/SpoIIIE domain-containing protein n=1 Tax=Leifsonia xyli TaxID=1575 RepID=UPI000429A9D6|nr:FtsK/SpoIIIE domain-containing protein [Leifsonia xyli]